MTKLQRQEGWFEGDQYRKDLQTELEKYIQRATKRGYNFVAIKRWCTRTHGTYTGGWDRVRLLDLKTGRVRNMFYCGGWHTATAKSKEKFIPLDITQDIVEFVSTGHLYSGRPAMARAKKGVK